MKGKAIITAVMMSLIAIYISGCSKNELSEKEQYIQELKEAAKELEAEDRATRDEIFEQNQKEFGKQEENKESTVNFENYENSDKEIERTLEYSDFEFVGYYEADDYTKIFNIHGTINGEYKRLELPMETKIDFSSLKNLLDIYNDNILNDVTALDINHDGYEELIIILDNVVRIDGGAPYTDEFYVITVDDQNELEVYHAEESYSKVSEWDNSECTIFTDNRGDDHTIVYLENQDVFLIIREDND